MARRAKGGAAVATAQARDLRVLVVSLFHPELVRGGAQQVAYELFQALRDTPGVAPVLLSSIDETYPALFKSGASITGFDGREGEFLFLTREYDYWWHRINAPSLIEAFEGFLETVAPDVVHFHHFFTFGIDLVTLTRRVLPQARIVFTFHEFMAICAADGHMVRKTDRTLCREASQVRCHQCFPERSPEQFLMRRMWFQQHLSHVDVFTCPSRFMIGHYTAWGIGTERIRHVTNGQRSYATPAQAPAKRGRPRDGSGAARNRFGFFGQMIDAKGVHVILRAVALLRGQGFTDFAVEINGENLRYASEGIRREIEDFLAAEAALPQAERLVSYNGGYHVGDLGQRMAAVDWVVVPSTWWEIFCLVISEAWMFGRPVICSNVGGPAERVRDGVDGLHFAVGDARALAAAMHRAATEPGLWGRLAGNLPAAPGREMMVEGFMAAYTDDLPKRGDVAAGALGAA